MDRHLERLTVTIYRTLTLQRERERGREREREREREKEGWGGWVGKKIWYKKYIIKEERKVRANERERG